MKNNLFKALAAAALVGSAAMPLAASAQVGPGYYGYAYGPSSVINAWTAGIPMVTPGFGQAYGAPAAAYYGYQDNYYGGYGSPASYGGYPQYQPRSYGPSTGYLNWVPQNYQYQPYWGNYNQAYMPNYYGGPVQQNYYGQQGYGYIPGVGCTSGYCPR